MATDCGVTASTASAPIGRSRHRVVRNLAVALSGLVVGHSVRQTQLRGTGRRFNAASATSLWQEGGKSSTCPSR
jgi:hypothetical protein